MMVAALDATAMIRIFRSVLCGLRGRASLDPSPNVPTKDSSAFDSNWLHTVRSCAGGGKPSFGLVRDNGRTYMRSLCLECR